MALIDSVIKGQKSKTTVFTWFISTGELWPSPRKVGGSNPIQKGTVKVQAFSPTKQKPHPSLVKVRIN